VDGRAKNDERAKKELRKSEGKGARALFAQ
jgi:hypothetical protein